MVTGKRSKRAAVEAAEVSAESETFRDNNYHEQSSQYPLGVTGIAAAGQLEPLIQIFEDHQLTKLEFAQGDFRVALERQSQLIVSGGDKSGTEQFMAAAPAAFAMPAAPATAVAARTSTGEQFAGQPVGGSANHSANHGANQNTGLSPEKSELIVKAPLVGTVYRARGPEQPSFVQEGSTINAGDVLCLIEAMKLFNEVTAPCSGVVAQILFEDGALAEYNQPLIAIVPDSTTVPTIPTIPTSSQA